MGYRYYIASMTNQQADILSTIDEDSFIRKYAEKDDDYIMIPGPYKWKSLTIQYELGKSVSTEMLEALNNNKEGTPFFLDEELQKRYIESEYTLSVIDKEGFIRLIQYFKQLVTDSYKDLLEVKPFDEFKYHQDNVTPELKMEKFIKSRIQKWDDTSLNYLDLNDKNTNVLSHFWDYEYEIFNLIHLLKTLDWDNNTFILYAF